MGKKSRRARALSGKGRTGVATAEVDTTMDPPTNPTITKEPSASVLSKNGESPFLPKVARLIVRGIDPPKHFGVVCPFDCCFLTTVVHIHNMNALY